jgi:uncharacterized protein (TIGR03382 family)
MLNLRATAANPRKERKGRRCIGGPAVLPLLLAALAWRSVKLAVSAARLK